jgi:hypothetical protein
MFYNLRSETQEEFEKALVQCGWKTEGSFNIIEYIEEEGEQRPVFGDEWTDGEIVLSTDDYTLNIAGGRRVPTGNTVIYEDGSEHDEYVMEGWYASVEVEELPEALIPFADITEA